MCNVQLRPNPKHNFNLLQKEDCLDLKALLLDSFYIFMNISGKEVVQDLKADRVQYNAQSQNDSGSLILSGKKYLKYHF